MHHRLRRMGVKAVKYRINPKNGDQLSVLGFGCMRFNKNEEEVVKQVAYAIEQGVNYFDTAYVYPNNEVTLGRVLKKLGKREAVKIATKLPPYLVKKREDLDKIFNTELERLQTDYIDYYFMHMLTDLNVWERMVKLGILDWIAEKKASGQIKNIGFSYHGGKDEFIKIIDAYDWEFCMIQYNYFDEHHQAGRSGLQYAHSKGLPVMIMEPLRGGSLVNHLPKAVMSIWNHADIKRSPAEWGLRWIWNQPEVNVVLSGMNSMEMIQENIKTASSVEAGHLKDEELQLFDQVVDVMQKTIKVPCTGCGYCVPCPVGVDIPTCFSCYNEIPIEGKKSAIGHYLMQTSMKSEPHNASLCIECGKCESHCPQKIEIRKELKNVQKNLEGFYYKPARFIIKKFMKL